MTMIDTKAVRATAGTPRRSLLQDLVVWNRAWIECRRLRRLDAAALRDMGIAPADVDAMTVAAVADRIRRSSR